LIPKETINHTVGSIKKRKVAVVTKKKLHSSGRGMDLMTEEYAVWTASWSSNKALT